jgi:hypothetical protein
VEPPVGAVQERDDIRLAVGVGRQGGEPGEERLHLGARSEVQERQMRRRHGRMGRVERRLQTVFDHHGSTVNV